MFEVGHKKLGGRQKGTKNKKTLLSIQNILIERGINPIEKLIDIAESSDSSPEQKIRIWQDISKYVFPRQKTIEPSKFTEEQKEVVISIINSTNEIA